MGFAGQTDGELLALFAANGNQAPLEEIIRRHARMVLTVCRRASRRARDCDDMMQSVFITLARKAPELKGYVSLAGWLHRTAWYTARRACRAMTIRRIHEKQAAEICTQIRQENADREGMREEAHRMIELLPDLYREALILHHLEGWTVEETAQLMGLKVGTVAARLSRGRQMLQGMLEAKGFVLGSATALTLLLADEESSAGLPGSAGGAAVALPPKVGACMAAVGESASRLSNVIDSGSPPSWYRSGSFAGGGARSQDVQMACAGVGTACRGAGLAAGATVVPKHASAAILFGCGVVLARAACTAAAAAVLAVGVPATVGIVHGGPQGSRPQMVQSTHEDSEESPFDSPSRVSSASVPEPGTLGIAAAAAALLLRRRR